MSWPPAAPRLDSRKCGLLLPRGAGHFDSSTGRLIVAEAGVAAVPDPSFLAAVVPPIVLPLLPAFAA